MPRELLTLKQIADYLGLPESTLRKYRDAYPQFIPHVGSGRTRRYRESAKDIFALIRDCREIKRLSWEETGDELLKRFPVNVSVDEKELYIQSIKQQAASKKQPLISEEFLTTIQTLENSAAAINSKIDSLAAATSKHEFLLTSVAGEVMRQGEASRKIKNLDTIEEDLLAIRKLVYSYNEVVQKQHKESIALARENAALIRSIAQLSEKNFTATSALPAKTEKIVEQKLITMLGLLDKSLKKAATQAISQLPLSPTGTAPSPPQTSAQKQSSSNDELTLRLTDELERTRLDLERYKALYLKTRAELQKAAAAIPPTAVQPEFEDLQLAEEILAEADRVREDFLSQAPAGLMSRFRRDKK